jgi:hypothetical protein
MSVFRVRLNANQPQNLDSQGNLDFNPSCGNGSNVEMYPSIQRTMYLTGPNLEYLKLADGTTFSGSNYFKQYCVPFTTSTRAILELVTDDGTTWDPENPGAFPVADSITVATSDTFSTNYVDIVALYGSYASYVQLKNNGTGATQDITVQLNGSSNAVFTLEAGDVQVFDDDFQITKVAFTGGSASVTIEVIFGIQQTDNVVVLTYPANPTNC